MDNLRKILYPFSVLYHGITAVRNRLYDLDYLQSTSFEVPVICVGNLSTGGTGKSPMIEYLISVLQEENRIAVLSRGYKRKTNGFKKVEVFSTATEVGDEPLQIKRKFPRVTVAVDIDRIRGIRKLEASVDVILLDDALQHRKVKPSFTILLTTYSQLYIYDHLLPAGNLRESRAGAKRADIIVVTKCPENLPYSKQQEIQFLLQPEYYQSVYFSTILYASNIQNTEKTLPLEFLADKEFTLVTGIANPKPMVSFLKEKGFRFSHLRFSDHHNFTATEIEDLEGKEFILTTEKDFMRLGNRLESPDLYYLPIRTAFLNREEVFEKRIKEAARPSVVEESEN